MAFAAYFTSVMWYISTKKKSIQQENECELEPELSNSEWKEIWMWICSQLCRELVLLNLLWVFAPWNLF